jgi:hypothetical protein
MLIILFNFFLIKKFDYYLKLIYLVIIMSFYVLEIFLDGDLKRSDYYIYDNLNDIESSLYNYLSTPTGCFETIWHGSNINLYLFENYIPVCLIDLHTKIFYYLEKYPYIHFDQNNKVMAYTNDNTSVGDDDAEYDEYFCVNICSGDEEINVYIDFSDMIELEESFLDVDEELVLPMYPDKKLSYGYNDLENDYFEEELSELSINI